MGYVLGCVSETYYFDQSQNRGLCTNPLVDPHWWKLSSEKEGKSPTSKTARADYCTSARQQQRQTGTSRPSFNIAACLNCHQQKSVAGYVQAVFWYILVESSLNLNLFDGQALHVQMCTLRPSSSPLRCLGCHNILALSYKVYLRNHDYDVWISWFPTFTSAPNGSHCALNAALLISESPATGSYCWCIFGRHCFIVWLITVIYVLHFRC